MDHPSPFSTLTLSSRSSAQSTEPSTPRSEYDFPNEFFGDYVPSHQADNYILVTGGLGYIGSHTTLELLKAGNNVVVIDDLSNSHYNVLNRIKALVNQHYSKVDTKCPPVLDFHQIDYRNTTDLRAVLDRYVLQPWTLPLRMNGVNQSKISGVIHFAAYKAVSESIRLPLNYYSNNVAGFVGLLETLNHYGIKNLVFSSSATVYGALDQNDGASIPEELCVHTEETYLRDTEPVLAQQGCRGLTNPYGRTKWMCEAILSDLCVSDPEWRVVALRYFNPVGCDPSGLLGEDPLGIPNNLMPIVCKVLRQEIPALNVFGSDYETKDGTGVRDFIHVCDLAKGHLAAIRAASEGSLVTPFRTFNLGSGEGHSVLDVVEMMQKVSNKDIPVRFTARRRGDVAKSVAKPLRAERELNWKTERHLVDSCRDTWNFIMKNPRGYRSMES
jgi:UDP-glucose 4-epimerase